MAKHMRKLKKKVISKTKNRRAKAKTKVVARKVAHNQIKQETNLKPMFKWTGGKRKEIKHFESFFPEFVKQKDKFNYVEPFVGAGAVYFYLNNKNGQNVINDFDSLLINFYQQIKNQNKEVLSDLETVSRIKSHDNLEAAYYKHRNKDKDNGLKSLSPTEKAIRFYVVNQLAFSGMRRFNGDGEFNVPFGHYKHLNTDILNSADHIHLLKNTKIFNGDFENVMRQNDQENTFMFLDPPYTRVFKKYSSDNCFDEKEQERLAKTFKEIKNAKVMIVIDKSELTERLYAGYIKSSYSLRYGVNIKNRFNADVEHLIICNY